MKDGTRFVIDDGKGEKPFETLLDEPDIGDQFYVPYKPGNAGFPPGVDEDPGRVRFEPLFRKMYGDCQKGEVEGKLVTVQVAAEEQGRQRASHEYQRRRQGAGGRLRRSRRAAEEVHSFLETLGRHLQLPRHRRHEAA